MPLLDIRKLFVKFSGRYDLVNSIETYEDNGADFFIKAGQRYLDRLLDNGKMHARYYGQLEAGRSFMLIPMARVIYGAAIYKATGSRICLEYVRADELKLLLKTELDIAEQKQPTRFAPVGHRVVNAADLSNIPALWANVAYEDAEYTAVFFGNPSDAEYGVEIQGLFYSPSLDSDETKSYWTEEHPEVLVQAALYTLERFYRNFEGMKESKAAIDDLVKGIDMDTVAQQIVEFNQIGG